jgi:hypothetical protein
MKRTGLLHSYFPKREDAKQALRHLRRRQFRRALLLHRTSQGQLQIQDPARLSRVLGVLLGGILLASVLFGLFPPFWGDSLGLGFLIIPMLGFLMGGFTGFVAMRFIEPKIPHEIVARHAQWVVPEETALVFQGTPSSISRAIPIIRQYGEPRPPIFSRHPDLGLDGEDEPIAPVPLTPAQIQQHAMRLARDHQLVESRARETPLLDDLSRAAETIRLVCQVLAESDRLEQGVSPTAEWLLDNQYIV